MHCLATLVGTVNGWARLRWSPSGADMGKRRRKARKELWITDESSLSSPGLARSLKVGHSAGK